MKAIVTGLVKQIGKTVTPALGKPFNAITFSLSSEALDSAAHLNNIKKEDTPPPKKYQANLGSDYGFITTDKEVEIAPPTPPQKKYQANSGSDYGFITTDKEVEIAPPKATAPSTQVGKAEKAPLTLAEVTCFRYPGNW